MGGLEFPEGPVALSSGSVLVTEIKRGTLTEVLTDGTLRVVAFLGGGPNGAAIGPDGLVYVCNNGGSVWHERDGITHSGTIEEDINQVSDYSGGRIETVDLSTGHHAVLFSECDGLPLRAPNDLVFDESGGLWFTDFGKRRSRDRDRTGVFYVTLGDGNPAITEAIFPLNGPNGIGLSPDGGVLYVAETEAARLLAWDVIGPGQLSFQDSPRPKGRGRLVAARSDGSMFDSLAVDSDGNIAVATLGAGGISVFDPDGTLVDFIVTNDPITTNICFGGDDLRTAYITCAGTGRLLSTTWPCPGLPLCFNK